MKQIPPKLRSELASDPYYMKCCLTKIEGELEWHHAWTYAKGQINERWNIVPVTHSKHAYDGDKDSIHNDLITRQIVKYLCLRRISMEDLYKRFPKTNWKQEFKYLEYVYENNKNRFPHIRFE